MASLGSLVIELAANTARLQGDLGRAVGVAERSAAKFRRAFSFLAGGFAGLAGGAGISALVRDAVSFGDEIQKGAARAGIAASTFSELAAAAKQVDLGIEGLSRGLRQMQVTISQAALGQQTATRAFQELGISLEGLRRNTPVRQLELIADGLIRIRDPADRARIGSELFGRAYLELVPLLAHGAEGIRQLTEEQKRLGATFTDEQISRLARTDEAIKKLSASWSGFARAIVAEIAPPLIALLNILTHQQTRLESLRAELATAQLYGFDPNKIRQLTGEIERLEQAETRLRANRALGERKARPFEVAQPAFDLDAAVARARAESERETRRFNAEREFQEHLQFFDELEANMRRTADFREDFAQTQRDFERDIAIETAKGTKQFIRELEKAKKKTGEFAVFSEQAARNVQNAFADFLFDPFEGGLRGMLKSFTDTLRRMVAEAASARILGGLSGLLGGFLGGLFGGGGGGGTALFGGARQHGGPVSAGRLYEVGERGREWFIPGQSGRIVPHQAGAVTVAPVYNIDARGATVDLIQRLPAVLRANNDELEAKIVTRIRRRVYDLG